MKNCILRIIVYIKSQQCIGVKGFWQRIIKSIFQKISFPISRPKTHIVDSREPSHGAVILSIQNK